MRGADRLCNVVYIRYIYIYMDVQTHSPIKSSILLKWKLMDWPHEIIDFLSLLLFCKKKMEVGLDIPITFYQKATSVSMQFPNSPETPKFNLKAFSLCACLCLSISRSISVCLQSVLLCGEVRQATVHSRHTDSKVISGHYFNLLSHGWMMTTNSVHHFCLWRH